MPTRVLVPPLGQTVDTVTLVSWYKREGDRVHQGEPLFVVETDKASLDVEAPASGTLCRVSAEAGDEVKALSEIALIAAEGEAVEVTPQGPAAALPDAGSSSSAPVRSAVAGIPGTAQARPDAPAGRERVFISPRARRLAEEKGVPIGELRATGPEGAIIERDVRAYMERQTGPAITPLARRVAEDQGVDWRALAGSGPRGEITRDDVESAMAAGQTARRAPEQAAGPAAEVVPMAGLRAVIAERMQQSSQSTAPVTLTTEADATALAKLRKRMREDGLELTYNDLLIFVLARALGEHPRLNASLVADQIKLWPEVHMGLAVDTERGLLVPVIRDAGRRSLAEIAQASAGLIDRARAGRCTPEELRGSTFTLTNLGPLGVDAFTPIINLPECAVLGVGRIKSRPVIVGKKVRERRMAWLSLTFDHRLVDGAPAARFLQRVVQLVERPHLLLGQ